MRHATLNYEMTDLVRNFQVLPYQNATIGPGLSHIIYTILLTIKPDDGSLIRAICNRMNLGRFSY